MSQTEDQLESGGGITNLFFDAENHERQSWRFCNLRLARSEVVYSTQIFIIIFLIIVSLVKFVFYLLECEDFSFWFSLLLVQLDTLFPIENCEKSHFNN